MNLENHGRAKKLLSAARIEGISAAEREWLESHLAACRECSNEARALADAIDSFRAFSVSPRPEAVRRTSLAVHRRARELRRDREHTAPLWVAVGASSVWAVATTPFAWSAFAWLGRLLHVSDASWQLGFLVWWFLPATVLAAVASWRHIAGVSAVSNPAADMS